MRVSPYNKPFEERIRSWEKQLIHIQEIFDEWLTLQRAWLYLAPLFSSEDINEHLPNEARRFSAVDAMWRKTMSDAKKTGRPLQPLPCCSTQNGYVCTP